MVRLLSWTDHRAAFGGWAGGFQMNQGTTLDDRVGWTLMRVVGVAGLVARLHETSSQLQGRHRVTWSLTIGFAAIGVSVPSLQDSQEILYRDQFVGIPEAPLEVAVNDWVSSAVHRHHFDSASRRIIVAGDSLWVSAYPGGGDTFPAASTWQEFTFHALWRALWLAPEGVVPP